jgi:cytochrome P450
MARSIPAMPGWPILGNLVEYNQNRLALYQRVVHGGGEAGAGRFRFGPLNIIVFSRAEEVGATLSGDQNFGISKLIQKAFVPLAQNGLLTSEGEFHRHQRKLMAPPLQPRHVANYTELMAQHGEQWQAQLKEGELIDLFEQMAKLTLSIVIRVLFGTTTIEANTVEMVKALHTVINCVNIRLSSPVLLFSTMLPSYRQAKKASALLRAQMSQMIQARRLQSFDTDLLALLLRARGENEEVLTEEQVMDEILTLAFAGHETVASALAWTWYLLCQHPEIYKRLQQEVDTVLQGKTPTYTNLVHLPYCLQVLKESLRIYPPIHAIVRYAKQATVVGEFDVQRGDTIIISPYATHHRPDYFPEPEQFKPDRFTIEQEKSLPRFAYIPFGSGPRICVGQHFALLEGQLLLATLAQRVSFTLHPNARVIVSPKVTLQPSHLPVIVQRRGNG